MIPTRLANAAQAAFGIIFFALLWGMVLTGIVLAVQLTGPFRVPLTVIALIVAAGVGSLSRRIQHQRSHQLLDQVHQDQIARAEHAEDQVANLTRNIAEARRIVTGLASEARGNVDPDQHISSLEYLTRVGALSEAATDFATGRTIQPEPEAEPQAHADDLPAWMR